jgi:hypothetical protein
MDNFSKVAICVLVGCVCAAGLLALAHQLDDSQANLDRAQAELIQAQTDLTKVESVAWQQRYILFATTLVTITHGIDLLDLLLLVLTAALGFAVAYIWKGGAAAR